MNSKKEIPFIKLILIDIDGCLNNQEIGTPLDLETLQHLQKLSLKARKKQPYPKITLNTGRYLNYAEVYSEILGIDDFFIFEMGNAIAKCDGPIIKVKKHPSLTKKMLEQNHTFQVGFLEKFPQYEKYFQKYKQFMTTFIFKTDSEVLKSCASDIEDYRDRKGFTFRIDRGHNFINILHKGIDKGTGFSFLMEQYPAIKAEEVATIGDSRSDWDFMQHSGFKACPSNGSKFLRKKCDMVSSKSEARGTLEILKKIILNNRD